ncbi:SET domain-containing protein [Mycena venus]|uniref:SET domain-containing protein n=1 Tax=Mycena venus TaxID=2733690 RepID=A0A8H7DAU1_9AGAR|nr:SET domain-containing protein [Mycena venus]
MVSRNRKLVKDRDAAPVQVLIGERKMEIYTVGKALTTTVSESHYYVPAEGNNPTFDALIPGQESLVLQMFIGRSHTFKKKGIALFRKRLRAFDLDRDWATNKIKFVFVVPSGYQFEVDAPPVALTDVEFYSLELNVGCYNNFEDDERVEEAEDDEATDEGDDL